MVAGVASRKTFDRTSMQWRPWKKEDYKRRKRTRNKNHVERRKKEEGHASSAMHEKNHYERRTPLLVCIVYEKKHIVKKSNTHLHHVSTMHDVVIGNVVVEIAHTIKIIEHGPTVYTQLRHEMMPRL